MDLNVRAKTIKILKENVGINLHDLEFADEFLGITSKAQGKRKKIGNLDSIKDFCVYFKGHHQKSKKRN